MIAQRLINILEKKQIKEIKIIYNANKNGHTIKVYVKKNNCVCNLFFEKITIEQLNKLMYNMLQILSNEKKYYNIIKKGSCGVIVY